MGAAGRIVGLMSGYEWGDPKNVEYVEWLYENCEEEQ